MRAVSLRRFFHMILWILPNMAMAQFHPQHTASCFFMQPDQGSRLRPAPDSARQAIAVLQQALQTRLPVAVTMGGTRNAMAAVLPNGYGDTVPVVSYDPTFLNFIHKVGGQWATFGVLAHELAHHVNGDTHRPGNLQRWQQELNADYISGLALARLGATLEQASAAVLIGFNYCGGQGPGYPVTAQRMQAIARGWLAATRHFAMRNSPNAVTLPRGISLEIANANPSHPHSYRQTR